MSFGWEAQNRDPDRDTVPSVDEKPKTETPTVTQYPVCHDKDPGLLKGHMHRLTKAAFWTSAMAISPCEWNIFKS